jgi:hypothetical protein
MTISKWERDEIHPTRFQAALLVAFGAAVARDNAIGRRAASTAAQFGIAAGLHELLHEATR